MRGSMAGYIPDPRNCDIQEFNYNAVVTANGWQYWNKPRGACMIYVFAQDSGGGGGGGATGATSTIRTGGGGGGSGARHVLQIPALWVPDELAIFVPGGGPGGAGNSNGTAGSKCLISRLANLSNAWDAYLIGTTAAGAGVKGSTTAGTAGAAGTFTAAPGTSMLGFGGILQGSNGYIGSASTVTQGTSITISSLGSLNPVIGFGGASGGTAIAANTDTAGGSNLAGTASNLISIPGGAAGGGAGAFGYTRIETAGQGQMISAMGGAGGGSNAAGTGGRGGDGGLGSGGGGGGGGITGGAGGNGGNGYIMIMTM